MTARTKLVTNASKYVRGFDPDTGRELWRSLSENTQVKGALAGRRRRSGHRDGG